MNAAKLCILAVALVVVARTRVTVLPGWQVPLPALLLAVALAAAAALAAWLLLRSRRHQPRHARVRAIVRRTL